MRQTEHVAKLLLGGFVFSLVVVMGADGLGDDRARDTPGFDVGRIVDAAAMTSRPVATMIHRTEKALST